MNLIDKDAVVATIKKHIQEERHSYFCKCLLSEIDTLKVKEQPSFPANLDEAARLSAVSVPPIWPEKNIESHIRGFKAGASWQKNQMLEHIKLAYGKVSMNPFDCSEAFEELLSKIDVL